MMDAIAPLAPILMIPLQRNRRNSLVVFVATEMMMDIEKGASKVMILKLIAILSSIA